MKNRHKALFFVLIAAAALFCLAAEGLAANQYEAAMSRWSRHEEYRDGMGGVFSVRATLYTTDYVNGHMQNEAEKNLWTASELEDYKYNFLNNVKVEEYLPIYLELNELGPTAHMAPFDEMIHLWVGNKKFAPVEYDQRFNFPLQGKRDGVVYFPRYDEKTGAPILGKSTTLRLVMVSGASPVLGSKEVRINWDVKPENFDTDTTGTAAARLEIDRLLKRMEKITGERAELESQLGEKNSEIDEINARIDELRQN
ncbi:MAG: hypothetical protein LBL73_04020 [Synergistaceae bacterium]|jgi:hypothetical protein|nr:hypothetical protein [Synergistaceae bacterium]